MGKNAGAKSSLVKGKGETSGSSELVKPTPPADLWNRLAAAVDALPRNLKRPPDAFTRKEFQEHRGIEEGAACRLLKKLVVSGRVKKVGYVGAAVYYILVEDDK